jgi:hypothetical protein
MLAWHTRRVWLSTRETRRCGSRSLCRCASFDGSSVILSDKFAPITSEIGFVEMPAEPLAQWFRTWNESNVRARGVRVETEPVSGSLEEILQRLQPLTSVERRRYQFAKTVGSWSAYFDNGWTGGDTPSLSYAARTLKCRAIRAVAIPDSRSSSAKSGRFGATIFELYGPTEDQAFLNYQRTVSVANDGGRWRFSQSGTPLDFEDPSIFAVRSVRDRFGFEHLVRYLAQFGISGFDASFYTGDGFLVERHGPHAPDMREYRLEDVRESWSRPTATSG